MNTVASRIAKNEGALKKYGISIKNANGDLKSTYDVLSELAGITGNATKTWDEMTKAEQVALGTTLAGVNQYKVFSAVMTNFDTAVKASGEALNSQGSAMRENAKYMESIQARLQTLKAELQKFILQGNVLQNVFKGVLSALGSLMKFFNSFEGKITLVTIALISLVLNAEKLLTSIKRLAALSGVVKAMSSLVFAFQAVAGGAATAGEAVEYLRNELASLNLNPIVLIISAIIAAVAALAVVIYRGVTATERHRKALEEQKNAIQESIDKTEEYKNRLKEVMDEMSKLNDSGLDIDKNYEENLRKLRQEKHELEELIKLEQARTHEEQRKGYQKAEKLLKSSGNKGFWAWSDNSKKDKYANFEGVAIQNNVSGVGNSVSGIAGKSYNKANYNEIKERYTTIGGLSEKEYDKLYSKQINNQKNLSDNLKIATANLNIYAKEYDDLYQTQQNLINKQNASKSISGIFTKEDEERLNNVNKELSEASEKLDLANGKAVQLADDLRTALESADPSTQLYKEGVEALDFYEGGLNGLGQAAANSLGIIQDVLDEIEEEEALEELDEKIKEVASSLGITNDELNNLRELFGGDTTDLANFISQIQESRQALEGASSAIDSLQSALATAKQAQTEFNGTGRITLDTFQSLLGISSKYLVALINENGQIEINDQTMHDLIGTMKKAKIEELQQAAATDVMNYALGNTDEMSTFAQEAVANLEGAVKAEGNSAVFAAQQNMSFTASVMEMAYASGEIDEEMVKKKQEGVTAIINSYKDIAKSINELIVDTSDLGDASTKAYGGANSELERQNELLQEQKQLLDDKKKQYDTVIAYIKKKIQDEIKKIEAEKKAQVEAIKEQIKALKELKEEELDRIDEQIDALKEQKEIEQEFWQAKIDALKEQNEELEEQLEYEQLLEDLAKAKSKRVRVYKEGQGFVYTEDGNEIDKAQAKLDEYERKKSYKDQLELLESYKKASEKNYEEQIKALEKLKDEKEKNYEEQIKALEKHQEEVEAAYDAQIAYFQEYLDKFTEQTDAYENETNRQLAIQLTGIDFEQQGWQKRLNNLSNFVEKYNALLGEIKSLDVDGVVSTTTTTSTTTSGNSGGNTGGGNSGDKNKGGSGDSTVFDDYAKTKQARQNVVNTVGGGSWSATSDWYAKNYGGRRPSGDSSISEDGMYLVGDSPNQELVIGSKLNGSLMSLSEGSGVVNATSTRTLAGVLNQLGLAGNQGINMSNSQNKSTNIQIGNISLPSVQNGKDFVDYLQNFSLQMTQEAFA